MPGLAYNLLKSPKDLKPHPLNKEIYGEENADPDLIESIRTKGILETLVIRDDNVILSGHRRWLAAKALNLEKVPCRILSFSDPLDEEESLIEFNRQRRKTGSQFVAESRHLEKIIGERQGKRTDLEPVGDIANKLSPETGVFTKTDQKVVKNHGKQSKNTQK